MEEITFKEWRVGALIVDTNVLRLEVEAKDGTDIIETGFANQGVQRGGEEYVLHFTTQQIEDAQTQPSRRALAREASAKDAEDDSEASWAADEPVDEDETLYVHGWEVNALVDEDGVLRVTVERGLGGELYELEPIESGVPLAPRVVVRLAAEDTDEDDDDNEVEPDGDDEMGDLDEYEELDNLEDIDKDYYEDDEEDDDLDDDAFDEEIDRY